VLFQEDPLKYQYLFGPIPSRRLGVSLGIDLFERKTCTLSCVYCECGPTAELSTDRKAYVPTDTVIRELDDYLAAEPALDYITFSGTGEPTLHNGIGQIIQHLKDHHGGYRVALLTNGTLFTRQSIREEVGRLDLVIPSMDAVSEEIFSKINRPHPSLSAEAHIQGLIALKKEFSGEFWLEVFIVPGLNDTPEELLLIREAIQRIGPDQVHLNTVDRPASEFWVEPVSQKKLQDIAENFENTHIVTDFGSRRQAPSFHEEFETAIFALLRRRPCTVEDIAYALDIHPRELKNYLHTLLEEGRLSVSDQPRGRFYKIKTMTKCQDDA
jgi:wyosine [tRNA(Phe)-imidazoG37] synthetase (radical SAM superfamily)